MNKGFECFESECMKCSRENIISVVSVTQSYKPGHQTDGRGCAQFDEYFLVRGRGA